MDFDTNCPHCGLTVNVGSKLAGTSVDCPKCGTQFRAPLPASRNSLWNLLDELETLLKRMIAGVFRFAFFRLPRLAYNLVVCISPILAKIVRVLILLAIWVWLAILPGLAGLLFTQALDRLPWWVTPNPVLHWCAVNQTSCRGILLTWSIIAIVGSIWGAVYIRRKIKRRRAVTVGTA
jgi:hypothetical protein